MINSQDIDVDVASQQQQGHDVRVPNIPSTIGPVELVRFECSTHGCEQRSSRLVTSWHWQVSHSSSLPPFSDLTSSRSLSIDGST